MTNKNWYANSEQEALAQELINKETAALEKWFKGDSSGYAELWSKTNFSYFDIATTERIDDYEEVMALVHERVDGKLFANTYEVRQPRVQFTGDGALLTYIIYADTNLITVTYNVVEAFRKEEDGEWRVIHSNWGLYRPMEHDWSKTKVEV